ncbi:MAG: alkaline phosphatase D family protein [Planctomycetota bacterium]
MFPDFMSPPSISSLLRLFVALLCSLLGPAIISTARPMVAQERDHPAIPHHTQGEKAGEPTQESIILLTRLTAIEEGRLEHDVPGMEGRARFELATSPDFEDSWLTRWVEAAAENDHIVKETVTGLDPGTIYWYRVVIAASEGDEQHVGPPRTFVGELDPDFLALTGDTVYYDGPAGGVPGHVLPPDADSVGQWKRQLAEMPTDETVFWLRKHWHAMYAFPIQREFFGQYPAYWEVDDHDYYKNDWSGGYWEPGSIVFREQNPVPKRTYRTVRWGKHLQIWLVEGREYRDKQADPPTIWGREQYDWLVDSLGKSEATFKVLISPTPVVGSGQKDHPDNHGCPPFLEERKKFFEAIEERSVENFYVVCGDKHRKHHSRAKTWGVHEFCCGALSPKHGGHFWPPEDKSGLLDLLHKENPQQLGGFLTVDVQVEDGPLTIVFTHYDAQGNRQARTRFGVQ